MIPEFKKKGYDYSRKNRKIRGIRGIRDEYIFLFLMHGFCEINTASKKTSTYFRKAVLDHPIQGVN